MMGKILTLCLAVMIVLTGSVCVQLYQFIKSPAHQEKKEILFEVQNGEGLRKISNRLQEDGLIKSSLLFEVYMRSFHPGAKIKMGEYQLFTDMNPAQIFSVLVSGKSVERTFTVAEGLNIYDIAELFESKGYGKKSEFLELCTNKKFIFSLLKEDLPSLEGYLFPETYYITKYTDPRTLIQQMVKRFLQVYSEVTKKGKANNSTISLKRHQIVTLASIIEKETGASQERTLISSVFYNRLEKKMLLQTDPTVLYGILDQTKEMKKNITRKDLETPTRYNTYTNKGLPYGPIANPGKESLVAALGPAKSNYLFFVSRNDGTHYFSENYQDHQQKVQQYQVHNRGRP